MDFNWWSDIDGCLFCNKIKEEQFNKRTESNTKTYGYSELEAYSIKQQISDAGKNRCSDKILRQ